MATESNMFFRFSWRSSFSSFSGTKKMGTRENTEVYLIASPTQNGHSDKDRNAFLATDTQNLVMSLAWPHPRLRPRVGLTSSTFSLSAVG